MTNVVLYAPAFYDSPLRRDIVDGEVLYLLVHLRSRGYHVTLVDNFHKSAGAGPVEGAIGSDTLLVVHLWTADAYGEPLARVADELAALRKHNSALGVLAFGPLAMSAYEELLGAGAADGVTHRDATSWAEVPRMSEPLMGLARDLQAHYWTFPSLTLLPHVLLGNLSSSVVSVAGSRACLGRCTFCSYNADVAGQWSPRVIEDAADDIAFLFHEAGVTRFAFSDNDFGGTARDCESRAEGLARRLAAHGVSDQVSISVSARPSTLSPAALENLAAAGVKTVLVGVESFSARALRLYGKPSSLSHLRELCAVADELGITIVASYILWHPWQTLASLEYELAEMRRFGRYRIPQFLARSVLQVIPRTPMERRLRREGLLIARPFYREFKFVDPEAERLFLALSGWFDDNVRTVLRESEISASELHVLLAMKKIAEFCWFEGTLPSSSIARPAL